jgi:dynein heavy chain
MRRRHRGTDEIIIVLLLLRSGQGPIAESSLQRASKDGGWLLLANCHLMISWLPTLEQLLEEAVVKGSPHDAFRLWITSSPSPHFPIGILQACARRTRSARALIAAPCNREA